MATRKSSREVKLALQRFRYAATGRWAISIRTYLAVVFPFGYLTSIEREELLNARSISQAAVIALGGELACALYLFVAQALLLGNRTRELQPLWKCVFVWFSAGLVRGLFTAVNAKLGFDQSYHLGVRLPAAIFYTGVAMALAAFYFGTIERRRIEALAMSSLGRVLEQEELGLTEIESQTRLSAIAVIEDQLLPQVTQLRNGIKNMLATKWASGSQDVEDKTLEDLYQQSLGLSRSLEEQKKSYGSHRSDKGFEKVNESSFTYISSLLPRVISIRVTFVMVLVGSFTGQFARNGFNGVIAGAIGATIITLYLLPFSQLLKRKLLSPWIIYPFAYIGVFFVQGAFNYLQPTVGISLEWYSGIKTTYGVFIASIIASLIIAVQGDFEGKSERGINLSQKVERMSSSNQFLENSVFASRYGTLQGKITGVTMALHLMSGMTNVSSERKSKLLSEANEMLADSINEIERLRARV